MTREPIQAVDAERVVLGAMMLDKDVIDDVTRHIDHEAFFLAHHSTIFRAILAAVDAGTPTQPIPIAARLASTNDLGKVGGAPYLLELMQAVPVAVQAGWYAERVARTALARGIEIVGVRSQELAHGLALDDPHGAIERIQADLDLLAVGPDSDEPVVWRDIVDKGLDALDAATQPDAPSAGIATGLPSLDEALGGGLRPGQLIVVAGRTSMGKSVLARTFARAAAFDAKLPTLLFSLEMTDVEVFNCVVSAALRIDLTAVNAGNLTDNDWTRVARFIAETTDVPLFVDDTPGVGLGEIRAKARWMQKRHGLGLLIVDYLGLVETVAGRDNRQVAVAGLTRGLKILAQQLGVPLVLCVQLNRGPEMRADKRPTLADLRESGAIENDSNVVILIHRDDYYDDTSPKRGEAELIIAKNRAGPKTTVTVAAQLHHSRFVDMAIV